MLAKGRVSQLSASEKAGRILKKALVAVLIAAMTACSKPAGNGSIVNRPGAVKSKKGSGFIRVSPKIEKLIAGAEKQVGVTIGYDPAYVKLEYPGGDVPIEKGVCTDVIVRAFRNLGVDLQKEIHEDMAEAFSDYPRKWGLSGPDSNIDHRRVANQMRYFERRGKSVPISKWADDYHPGDIVAWDLGNNKLHIGIVADNEAPGSGNRFMIHNVGAGASIDDVLFDWEIIGHYRYFD